MRSPFKLVLALLLTIVIAGACANSKNNSPSPSGTPAPSGSQPAASEQPQAGGSLIIGVTADPVSLNPLISTGGVGNQIKQALFAPLFQDTDGKKTYYLAESVTPSADQLTYTVKLKKDLVWHDGEPLTADDVVFSIERALDEKENSFLRSYFLIDKQPIQPVKVDNLTVAIKLPRAAPTFEAALVQLFPIPKHLFDNGTAIDKNPVNNAPVGSGPFKFKTYKTGEYVTLERFDAYFAGKPYLDSLTFRIVKDTDAAILAKLNGELNLLRITAPQYASQLNNKNDIVVNAYATQISLNYLILNQTNAALKNKAVRQAIGYALNKEELIATAYGSPEYADITKSVLPPRVLYHTDDLASFDNDPAQAKALLQAASVSDLKLRFMIKAGNKLEESIGLYVQQKLKDIGIAIELLSVDASSWGAKLGEKDAFDITFSGYDIGYDPAAYSVLYESGSSSNFLHYSNPELDQLWQQGAIELDPAKRSDIYKQIQSVLAEEAVIYPIANPKQLIAVDARFGGFEAAKAKQFYMFEDWSKVYQK